MSPSVLLANTGSSETTQASAQMGSIQGRVLNRSSGSYLNNARVTVRGTSLETLTDSNGAFRLSNVPAGNVRVDVHFVGLATESLEVAVPQSSTVLQDFSMRLEGARADGKDDVLQLDAFTVTQRQLSGRASALQEQKAAPNIKNVIAFDEFGEMGEGNVAEYLKFVPGVDITYSPNVPTGMSIRGMPASGTLVTIDGATPGTTNAGVSRNFDFSLSATANIDRVEITKTPTPDLPANAVGGSVNIITKTGFSQAKPSLKYNFYLTHDELGGLDDFNPSFSKSAGPDSLTTKRDMQPSYTLAYVGPLNDKLAFTFTASHAGRKMDWRYFSPTWDRVRMVQTANAVNTVSVFRTIESYSGSLSWRISPNDLLTFGIQRNIQDSAVRSNTFTFTLGAGTTGDSTYSQGAATGVGAIARSYTANVQEKTSDVFSIRYKHDGPDWKYDAMINYSPGKFVSSPQGKFFTNATTTNSLSGNLILRLDDLTAIGDLRNPVYSATNRAGQPVDIYTGDTLSLTAAGLVVNARDHEATTAGFNTERKLGFKNPLTLKMGVLVDRQERVMSNDTQSRAFNPPTGAAGRLLSNYDVFAREYSNRVLTVDARGTPQKPMHLDLEKLHNLYLANPTWFTINEASRYINWVNNRRNLEETISAGYIRGDMRFIDNRLWIIGGVRYEHTNDKGAGPNDNITAIYVRNPDGSFARTPAGALIPKTTNALEQAKLRYTELGTVTTKNYDGFYPSVNSSFEITPEIILRAAYARTIGRPELTEIIPGATIADPDATNRNLAVNNTALDPWTSDNFDLTIETYSIKGASASASLFQKNVTGFFTTTITPATREYVESLGLAWDEAYSTYDVETKRNGGSASVKGLELSYRQSFVFLPGWGRNFQAFVNFTAMTASGPDAESFSYSPQRINWGIGYYGRKFSINLNVADGKPMRSETLGAGATTPAGTYRYIQEYPRYDLSAEYNFTKRLGVYASVRNLTGSPQRQYDYNPSTPDFARPRQFLYAGALISMGIKGEW